MELEEDKKNASIFHFDYKMSLERQNWKWLLGDLNTKYRLFTITPLVYIETEVGQSKYSCKALCCQRDAELAADTKRRGGIMPKVKYTGT